MKLARGGQIQYFMPLKKWRLMDLDSLRRAGNYPGSMRGFRKLISSLEQKGVLQSTKDNHSTRKYVYLTRDGGAHLGLKDSFESVSLNNFDHDSRLASFARSLLSFEIIEDVELDHSLISGKKIGARNRFIPDGLIHGKKNGNSFDMAFELELTLKSKDRYMAKIEHYLDTTVYDYALYIFYLESVRDCYKKEILKHFGKEAFEKIILGLNTNLLERSYRVEDTSLYFKSKEMRIDEVF